MTWSVPLNWESNVRSEVLLDLTKSYPFNPAFGALDSKPTRQDKTRTGRANVRSEVLFCRSQLLNLAYTLRVTGVKLFMECLWSAEKLVLF